MSSANVDLRRQLSTARERWRAAERSRVKLDERRRIEAEREADDVQALRYRWVMRVTRVSLSAPLAKHVCGPDASQFWGSNVCLSDVQREGSIWRRSLVRCVRCN